MERVKEDQGCEDTAYELLRQIHTRTWRARFEWAFRQPRYHWRFLAQALVEEIPNQESLADPIFHLRNDIKIKDVLSTTEGEVIPGLTEQSPRNLARGLHRYTEYTKVLRSKKTDSSQMVARLREYTHWSTWLAKYEEDTSSLDEIKASTGLSEEHCERKMMCAKYLNKIICRLSLKYSHQHVTALILKCKISRTHHLVSIADMRDRG